MRDRSRVAVYCIVELRSVDPVKFDYFKIGISSSPYARLRSLQIANPRPLAILMLEWFKSRELAERAEKAIHEYGAAGKVSGEWFDSREVCPFEMTAVCSRVASNRTTDSTELFYEADLAGKCLEYYLTTGSGLKFQAGSVRQ